MHCLLVLEGPEVGRRMPLPHGDVRLGREPSISSIRPGWVYFRDPTVSRHHATLRWQGDRPVLIHESKTNETFVNGQPIKEAELGPRDVARMGTVAFRLAPHLETDALTVEDRRDGAPVETASPARLLLLEGAERGRCIALDREQVALQVNGSVLLLAWDAEHETFEIRMDAGPGLAAAVYRIAERPAREVALTTLPQPLMADDLILLGPISLQYRIGLQGPEHAAVALVRRTVRKLAPDVKVTAPESRPPPPPTRPERLDALEMASTFRQLAVMLRSGVVVTRAIETLAGSSRDPRLKRALGDAQRVVEEGGPLSAALQAHEEMFTPAAVRLIYVGEASGSLDMVLDRLSVYLEKRAALQLRVQSMLVYPAFTCGAFLLAVIAIPTVLMHGTLSLLTDLRVAVPLSTRILIAVAGALRQPLFWLAAAVGGAGGTAAFRTAGFDCGLMIR